MSRDFTALPSGDLHLLSAEDPPAVTIYNAQALESSPVLLICDHASNAMPQTVQNLGLNDHNLTRHIAYDIGSAAMTRRLADIMDAPAVMAGYSRLLVDLNRDPQDPGSIPAVSDRTEIPGNRGLNAAMRTARLDEIYTPYHRATLDSLNRIRRHTKNPFVLSVHSFTPKMDTETRKTEIGILWDTMPDLAQSMIDDLQMYNPSHAVAGNDPYSFLETPELNHTIHRLKDGAPDLAYIVVELRQDLIATDDQAHHYADLFHASLNRTLKKFGLI